MQCVHQAVDTQLPRSDSVRRLLICATLRPGFDSFSVPLKEQGKTFTMKYGLFFSCG